MKLSSLVQSEGPKPTGNYAVNGRTRFPNRHFVGEVRREVQLFFRCLALNPSRDEARPNKD